MSRAPRPMIEGAGKSRSWSSEDTRDTGEADDSSTMRPCLRTGACGASLRRPTCARCGPRPRFQPGRRASGDGVTGSAWQPHLRSQRPDHRYQLQRQLLPLQSGRAELPRRPARHPRHLQGGRPPRRQAQRGSAHLSRGRQAWQVSPKVILATLQKEQGLLSATSPSTSALDWAMGCGVPRLGGTRQHLRGLRQAGLVRRRVAARRRPGLACRHRQDLRRRHREAGRPKRPTRSTATRPGSAWPAAATSSSGRSTGSTSATRSPSTRIAPGHDRARRRPALARTGR